MNKEHLSRFLLKNVAQSHSADTVVDRAKESSPFEIAFSIAYVDDDLSLASTIVDRLGEGMQSQVLADAKAVMKKHSENPRGVQGFLTAILPELLYIHPEKTREVRVNDAAVLFNQDDTFAVAQTKSQNYAPDIVTIGLAYAMHDTDFALQTRNAFTTHLDKSREVYSPYCMMESELHEIIGSQTMPVGYKSWFVEAYTDFVCSTLVNRECTGQTSSMISMMVIGSYAENTATRKRLFRQCSRLLENDLLYKPGGQEMLFDQLRQAPGRRMEIIRAYRKLCEAYADVDFTVQNTKMSNVFWLLRGTDEKAIPVVASLLDTYQENTFLARHHLEEIRLGNLEKYTTVLGRLSKKKIPLGELKELGAQYTNST